LTIYTNSGSDGRGEWLEEKAKEAGFDIQFIDAGAAETQSRLIAEKNAPVADVVFGLNSIIWSSLKSEDILTEYVPKWAGEVESELNDSDGFYHATVKQAILLCYDENQISEEEAPKDWPDLWQKEEFHGKYEYLTGLSGGTVRNVLAGILTRYADPEGELGISDEGWKEIESYYKNGSPNESGVDLYARIADTNNPIVCGQMWSSGIESRDEQYGTKTAYVVPEVGVPYAVEAIGIVNGTKN
jgi:ABC-type Fe3+ transport system, periplasmic component